MVTKDSQPQEELHLLVLFGDNEHTFIEWADTTAELNQLEEKWTVKVNDYSLPIPDFKHWEQEAKEGKCYALCLRIENCGHGYVMAEEGITKDRYESIIEVNQDLARNRFEESIKLLKNLPNNSKDSSKT